MHYIFTFRSLTPTYVSALSINNSVNNCNINNYETLLYVIQNITADNNVCKVNVHYEPPEDSLERAETYVGVKE
jgi:hypothetical protein